MKAKRAIFSQTPIHWLFLLTLALSLPAHADIGTEWLAAQRSQDGAYALATDTSTAYQATAETLRTAHALGTEDRFDTAGALAYLDAEAYAGTEYLARKIIAWAEIGGDVAHLLSELAERQGLGGGYAELPGYAETVLDTACALQALAAADGASSPVAAQSVGFLLERQNEEGAWSDNGNAPSVFLTSLVLRALWQFRHLYALDTAMADAQAFLLSRRQNGVWAETFQTALALIAVLPRLDNPIPLADAIDSLQAEQRNDGSWDGGVYTTALVLRALSLAGQSVPNPDLGALTGRVVDGQTGLPLAGVEAALDGPVGGMMATGADGAFRFEALPGGNYTLTLTFADYTPLSAATSLYPGRTLDFGTLTLVKGADPITGTVRGTVTDAETGLALGGALVVVADQNASAVTDAGGGFQIGGLEPGPVTVSALLDGYYDATGSATLAAGGILVFSPALSPAGTGGEPTEAALYGRIADAATGLPLSGVSIEVTGSTTAGAITDADGHYRIGPLQPGAINIGATLAGYDPVSAAAVVYERRQIHFSPLLYAQATSPPGANAARITGAVLDSSTNTPLEGVLVEATRGGSAETLSTDSAGRFDIGGIEAAQIELRFSRDGYRSSAFAISVEPLAELDIGQVRLRPESADALLPDLVIESLDTANRVTDPQTLLLSGTLEAVIENGGTSAVENGFDVLAFYDTDGDDHFDIGTDPVLGAASVMGPLPVDGEDAVSIDLGGVLPFRDAPVTVWADSGEIVVELDEANNTASTASVCRSAPAPGSASELVLKWSWPSIPDYPELRHVVGAVLVGQLSDDNADGRIDARDTPDLVFAAGDHPWQASRSVLVAVSGSDGRELWHRADLQAAQRGSGALGDIDNDGLLELVVTNLKRDKLMALEHDGTLKWSVPTGPATSNSADGLLIVDLDGDGEPEIIQGRRAFDNAGNLLWTGTADQAAGGNGLFWGYVPIAADVDHDGSVEVIAGRTLYNADGNVVWHRDDIAGDGFSAVGNFDADDFAEILLVSKGQVYLLEHTGETIWGPVVLPGSDARGGTPTVADFDNDGEPEIGVAGATRYTVFESDGSVKWTSPIQDTSSAATGSTVFDFEDDGKAEVLYADEQHFRIYDGESGAVLVEIPNSSVTATEYPVVADIDNDNSADIIIPANGDGQFLGVRVFESATGSWPATRSLWNQHSYHITNINDDGTIPRHEKPSWLVHNTYRLNTLIDRDPLAKADLSVARLELIDNGMGQPFSLAVRAGNGGSLVPGKPVVVTYYQGDPDHGGRSLGSTGIDRIPTPGYLDLTLDGVTLGNGNDLYAVIDPDDAISECNELNNRAQTGIPASTRGRIQVATDAPEYPPNAPVRLRATLANAGAVPGSFTAKLRVEDPAGALVIEYPARDAGMLAGGASIELAEEWNTGLILAGSYTLVGEVYGADATLHDSHSAGFRIVHPDTAGPRAGLRTTTDRPRYHTTDSVNITNRVRNLTASTLIDNAALRVRVTGPAGQPLFEQTLPLGQLPPGASRDRVTPYILKDAPIGAYRARGELLNGSGAVLASDSAGFEVVQDPEQVVSGEVTAQFDQRYIGQQQICTDRITNNGSLDIDDLSIRRLLTRLDDPAEIDAVTAQIALPAGATHTLVRSIETGPLAAGDYACVLQALFDPDWATLDFDGFRLDIPPIDATLATGTRGRLLVLLDVPPQGSGRGGNDPEPTLAAQRAYLEELLIRNSWSYTLVTDKDAFAEELHSGGYSAYALLAEQEKLDESVQEELREAVFRGEGLLLAGGHDQRHHGLQPALGIGFRGKHPDAGGLTLEGGTFATPGQRPFGFADNALKADPAGAQTVGRFDGLGEDPAPAAVTTHAYGWGRAVYGGFDLLAQAAAAGGDNLYSGLILDALTHVQPAEALLADGAVIPISLTVTNQNGPNPIEARLYPPAQASLVDPGGAEEQPDGSLLWRLTLAENETVILELWMSLPRGSHSFSADTRVGQPPSFLYTETDRLTLEIPAPQPLAAVVDRAAALEAADRNGPYKQVRQSLERAASWQAKGDLGKAIDELLKATEPLQDEPGLQAAGLRRAIDRQIWHSARLLVGP